MKRARQLATRLAMDALCLVVGRVLDRHLKRVWGEQ